MTKSVNLGAFLSSAKGFLHMGKEAKEADMQTMSFFLRNPRGGKAKPLDEADMRAFSAFLKENNFAPAVAHAPYTMNPCSPNESTRQFARKCLRTICGAWNISPAIAIISTPVRACKRP